MSKRTVIGILGELTNDWTVLRLTANGLALQGAFIEHQAAVEKLSFNKNLQVVLVKNPEDLEKCDALIIPGGGKDIMILSLL